MSKYMKNEVVRHWTMCILGVLVILIIAGTYGIQLHFQKVTSNTYCMSKNEDYEWHLAFIADDDKDSFMQTVMESAKRIGKEKNILVEVMGEELEDNFTKQELMELSIEAQVDGIILEGDSEDATSACIHEAKMAGIPVMTVLADCTGSDRESFIGINYFRLGQYYGEQVLSIAEGKQQIDLVIILDKSPVGDEQSITYSSICQKLENNKKVKFNVKTVQINKEVPFEAEEKIRNLWVHEEVPDIVICLNELFSTCAVQAVIDHNKVGKTKLMGFYENETILDAIQDQVMHCTVSFDAEEMGNDCIRSMIEYFQTGYVNEYQTVNTFRVDQEYLQNE